MLNRSRTLPNWGTIERHADSMDAAVTSVRAARFVPAFDPIEVELAGLPVTLRLMEVDDAAGYREFISRIDRRDLSLRVGRDIELVQGADVARLAQPGEDLVLIATIPGDGSKFEIVGDARARVDAYAHGSSGEFAIVVRSDLLGLGLGKALLDKLIEGCAALGVELLYGRVAASNRRMLALARKLGFDVDHVPGGTTAVVSLDLQTRQRLPASALAARPRPPRLMLAGRDSIRVRRTSPSQ